jgi:hypothetical protein
MFRRVENRKEWLGTLLHGWFLKSPQGLSKGGKGVRLMVGREHLNPRCWPRALYSPAMFIGSTDRGRYYHRSAENETERSYRYTDLASVLPGGVR